MLSSIYSNKKPDYAKFNIQKDIKEKPFIINTMREPSIHYLAIVETEEVIHKDSDQDSDQDSDEDYEFPIDISSKPWNEKNTYPTPTLAPTYEDSEPDPFSLGKDPIKTFYIGSVTVVGLYILYKILNKR